MRTYTDFSSFNKSTHEVLMTKDKGFSRRTIMTVAPAALAGLVFATPKTANAFLVRVVFRGMSYGIGKVIGAGVVGFGATALGLSGGTALVSAFGRRRSSSRGSGYYDSYAPIAEHYRGYRSEPITISISLDPTERVTGEILRLRAIAQKVLVDKGIPLPNSGKLEIQEDGKMTFVNSTFEGYVHLHYNDDLTVWTPDDQLVLVRSMHNGDKFNIQQDSPQGRLALTSLLGDIEYA